ncbi:hypothetical protein DXG01_014469 [Tephrocybe rancida]|nr:hypothetical protein DXG01_014469 [Tephrocybe rancida]
MCMRTTHLDNPLHSIETWTGEYFRKAELWEVGCYVMVRHTGNFIPICQSLKARMAYLERFQGQRDSREQQVLQGWQLRTPDAASTQGMVTDDGDTGHHGKQFDSNIRKTQGLPLSLSGDNTNVLIADVDLITGILPPGDSGLHKTELENGSRGQLGARESAMRRVHKVTGINSEAQATISVRGPILSVDILSGIDVILGDGALDTAELDDAYITQLDQQFAHSTLRRDADFREAQEEAPDNTQDDQLESDDPEVISLPDTLPTQCPELLS